MIMRKVKVILLTFIISGILFLMSYILGNTIVGDDEIINVVLGFLVISFFCIILSIIYVIINEIIK